MPNPIRQEAINGLQEGQAFIYSRTFTREETELFGEISRDYNPVHYDLRWSAAKGFHGLICHGLLVGSMICEFGGQVGWLATGMRFNFLKPVYFGDAITCRITMTRIHENGRAEAEAIFTNGAGDQVCRAFLSGLLPIEEERGLLKKMVDEGDTTNRLSRDQGYSFGKA